MTITMAIALITYNYLVEREREREREKERERDGAGPDGPRDLPYARKGRDTRSCHFTPPGGHSPLSPAGTHR